MDAVRRPKLSKYQLPAQDGQWVRLATYLYHLDSNPLLRDAHEVRAMANQIVREARRLCAEARELRQQPQKARGGGGASGNGAP